jgi:hypothetical protein
VLEFAHVRLQLLLEREEVLLRRKIVVHDRRQGLNLGLRLLLGESTTGGS